MQNSVLANFCAHYISFSLRALSPTDTRERKGRNFYAGVVVKLTTLGADRRCRGQRRLACKQPNVSPLLVRATVRVSYDELK